MSDMFSCRVEGGEELEDAMLASTELARKASRGAFSEAGDFMIDALSAAYNASHRITGFLAGHIVKKITLSVKSDQGSVEVGPTREAWYSRLIEYGAKHNAPPDPVIRRTFEQKWQQMLDVFTTRLRKELGL